MDVMTDAAGVEGEDERKSSDSTHERKDLSARNDKAGEREMPSQRVKGALVILSEKRN